MGTHSSYLVSLIVKWQRLCALWHSRKDCVHTFVCCHVRLCLHLKIAWPFDFPSNTFRKLFICLSLPLSQKHFEDRDMSFHFWTPGFRAWCRRIDIQYRFVELGAISFFNDLLAYISCTESFTVTFSYMLTMPLVRLTLLHHSPSPAPTSNYFLSRFCHRL
jgi:hypothetical protein